jgi:hypothetical protein
MKGRLHLLLLTELPVKFQVFQHIAQCLWVNIARSLILPSRLRSSSSRRVAPRLLEYKSSNLWESDHIQSQSLKLPNFWISAPVRNWNEIPLVALRSSVYLGECHKPDRYNLLSHCAVSVRVKACLACSGNFTGIKNGQFSWAMCFGEILFQIKENIFGDFRNVKTRGSDM